MMTTEKIIEGLASAQVICDSMYESSRLVTVEVEFPRPYLAEFNTHTRLSRNSASSRAIPVWKRMLTALERPYIPASFGTNKSGMQAGDILSEDDQEFAALNWLVGRDFAVVQAFFLAGGHKEILDAAEKAGRLEEGEKLCADVESLVDKYMLRAQLFEQDQGLHKQHANRVLEPYSFHTVVATGTHWRNFFGLRVSKMAQPEAQDFGIAIAKAMMGSSPIELVPGEWHLPYIRQEDRDEEPNQFILAGASSGKCARTSYLTHDGIRSISKDVEMSNGLQSHGHMSPFQHPARPKEKGDPEGSHGNYSEVWTQYRKLLKDEGDFSKLVSNEELLSGCRGNEALLDFILSFPE